MLIKVIKQWNRLQESWCRSHLRDCLRLYTLFPQNFFSRVTESGKIMGGCKFGNILPIIVQKCYRGYSLNFLTQPFQTRQTFIIWSRSLLFFQYSWRHENALSRQIQIHKFSSQSRCLDERENLRITSQLKDWVWHTSARSEVTSLEAMLTIKLKIGEVLRRKWTLKTVSAFDFCSSAYFLSW